MTKFGPYPFEVTSNPGNPPVGNLTLNYTIDPDSNQMTSASLEYLIRNGGSTQTITMIPETMTSPPYLATSGSEALKNPWNVPGVGAYKYASFSFTPPAGSDPGTFTGAASKDPMKTDDESINWEADSSTGSSEEEHHHHHHSHHS